MGTNSDRLKLKFEIQLVYELVYIYTHTSLIMLIQHSDKHFK